MFMVKKILILCALCLSLQVFSEGEGVSEGESYVLLGSRQMEDQTQREYWFVPARKVLVIKVIYPDFSEEIITTKPFTEEELLGLDETLEALD